jgi:hypothetical protein
MPIVTEGRHTGHFLLSEASGSRSRDVVTLAAGSGSLASGTVLGRITASKTFVAHDPAATDGRETACAILLGSVAVTADADVDAVAITRDAEVKAVALGFAPATDTAAEQAVVLAALAEHGIIGR